MNEIFFSKSPEDPGSLIGILKKMLQLDPKQRLTPKEGLALFEPPPQVKTETPIIRKRRFNTAL